jgi:hypothetical protein
VLEKNGPSEHKNHNASVIAGDLEELEKDEEDKPVIAAV